MRTTPPAIQKMLLADADVTPESPQQPAKHTRNSIPMDSAARS
jgi:hypothetical protein